MRKEPVVVKSVVNVTVPGSLIHFHWELKFMKSTRMEKEALASSYFGFG
jgi:hypothetical protein